METYSIRSGLDLDDISLGDAGNVTGLEGVMASLERIEEAVGFTRAEDKVPVMLGGERAPCC